MKKNFIIKAECFPNNVKSVNLEISDNKIKIISINSAYNPKNIGVPFAIFEKFCNKIAIDSEKGDSGFGEIKFVELEDYCIYPSFTPSKFAEIAPINTFHPSIIIKNL